MYSTEETLSEGATMTAAIQFINSTASHIFLTGKAGTGKTTFLKNLAARTHKQLAIVAPTGIAALNAGGVTIHSQFLLPFGMFLPDGNSNYSPVNAYNAHTLAQKHPINSVRKQVLRAIDLLVIDEVSMLRADLLDAIDARMKSVRGNYTQSFGGVQLLLIGDLYQLPPVVKREEEMTLREHYKTAWFFESKALQRDGFVYIELDKIFRQSDDKFIGLLNNLRNNQPTKADIDELNKHYKSADEIYNLREVITLTTHNYKADDLNMRALNELPGAAHVLHASIEGEFPESMFPVLQHLELKVGAQVMFTKNDSDEKMYFNGKLATVHSINEAEIKVKMEGTNILYTLKKAIWENKRYTVSADTQDLEDEVIGTFEQYPVKLAWAITVHKSQGLTFDRAIIDVGQAFADGQVYVALSRLRSLDGLIMRTRIDPDVITTDKQIVSFTTANNQPEMLSAKMKVKQREYIRHLISKTFDFETLVRECVYIQQRRSDTLQMEDHAMRSVLEQLSGNLLNEKENTQKFRRQLLSLLDENNNDQLLERIKKGSAYYKNFLDEKVSVLLLHIEEVRHKKRMKTYFNSLCDLDQLFAKKLEEVDKSLYLTESILAGHYRFDFSVLSARRAEARAKILEYVKSKVVVPSPQKKKSGKKKKGELNTIDITLKMLESGMTIAEISKERELVIGTIAGHLAVAVAEGRTSIFSFMTHEEVDTIQRAVKDMPEGFTSKDLFTALKGQYNYAQLRAVMNHMKVVTALTIE